MVRPAWTGERGQVRVDLRYRIQRRQRFQGERQTRWSRLPDQAQLGQCIGWLLLDVAVTRRTISPCMAWPCTGFSFLEGLSMRTPTLILAFCGLLSAPALAQSPASRPASTPTRGMVVFGTLEQDLAKALVAGRGGDADKLLAADFEQRDAAAPAQPLPRAEWLASQQAGEALPALSQMTVHDFGSLAVVSFISSVLSPPAAPSP